jgi:hypothetical protein
MIYHIMDLRTKKCKEKRCEQPAGHKAGDQQFERREFFLLHGIGSKVSHDGFRSYWMRL